MKIRPFICAQVFLFFLPASGAAPAAGGPPRVSEASGVTFRDFNSVVNMALPETVRKLQFGWARNGFSWGGVEPQKGVWDWRATDSLVLRAHALGVQILPNLLYTVPWAESIPGNHWSPPKHVQDWESYVEHVVARYSRPPFNLRYFQVWNEPTREAGFWAGKTNRDFIDTIYLPAAKIIRKYKCRVVFGGWPDSNSLAEYDDLLKYHDAWKWTDILDLHYRDLSAWRHLYTNWIKTRKCLGIWETEVGYTSDPDFLPSLYLRVLQFCLESGWNDANQYKLFWYASWGAGKDGPNCLTMPSSGGGTSLTVPGKELVVLDGVLKADKLSLFSAYTVAHLRGQDQNYPHVSVIGFKVGNHPVLALLFDEPLTPKGGLVSLKLKLLKKPEAVTLIGDLGTLIPLEGKYRDGQLTLKISRKDVTQLNETGKTAIVYILVRGGRERKLTKRS